MIARIFETQPALSGSRGSKSLATPRKYLSLSFFTDEDAVAQWRDLWGHRAARAQAGTLGAYRLRMAWVSQDYGMPAQAATGGGGGGGGGNGPE